MKRQALMIGVSVAVAIAVLPALAACTAPGTTGGTTSASPGASPAPSTPAPSATPAAAASVGSQIWLTGVGSDGKQIVVSAPPPAEEKLPYPGRGCASCHGVNGKGGSVKMKTGGTLEAPDVRYSELIKAGFKDATIRKAITDGLDEEGAKLNPVMPKWTMSPADLDATIEYMKALK